MALTIQICKRLKQKMIKITKLFFFLLALNFIFLKTLSANSGSYVAGKFAEMNRDFSRASDYYIDLVSRGKTNDSILGKAIVYSSISGEFDISLAIARKIDSTNLRYRPSSLLLFADAVKKRDKKLLSLSFSKHKNELPNFFNKITKFWILIINNKKDEAFRFINSIEVNNETQLKVIHYNQLLGYVHFDAYDLASTLYLNGEFNEFLFDSSSALAIAYYFFKKGNIEIAEELSKKIKLATDRTYYSLSFLETIKDLKDVKKFEVDPYKQLAEIFFRWSQTINEQEKGYVSKLFYLSLALHASRSSTFFKLKLAEILVNLDNNDLVVRGLEGVKGTDIFYLDTILQKVTALNQNDQREKAEIIINQLLEKNYYSSEILKFYGNVQRKKFLYSESIITYSKALEAAEKEGNLQGTWPILFLRGIAYERQKNWSSAEKDFISALEINPEQPQILNYMGYSLLERREKLDQAMRMIIKANEKAPDSYHIIDSLGWAFYKTGNFEEALFHLERAMELESLDPIVNDHLGDTFWKLDRKREARFQWKKALNLDPDEKDAQKIREKIKFGLINTSSN
ncbi:hypothetical protein CBE37_02020 [bacterium TMED277]|nr:MAG: hypothetical protein CBE37_02020 [bacterium TMED277]